jgi:hypothetical protein
MPHECAKDQTFANGLSSEPGALAAGWLFSTTAENNRHVRVNPL